jgi:hypothetical protein
MDRNLHSLLHIDTLCDGLCSYINNLVHIVPDSKSGGGNIVLVRVWPPVDVVDGARPQHRSAMGWFVGDGENARYFSAAQKVEDGTLRHVAAVQQFGCFRNEADIEPNI